MVALEAMQRARPVVAADVGGLSELVVDGETGLLVPTAEAAPLSRALVAVAANPELRRRMGDAGRKRALEHFAEERNVERTELLYRRFLDGNGNRPSDAAASTISRKSNGTR
jgi:glycosyltransferase involved in cell wall biosynthesis